MVFVGIKRDQTPESFRGRHLGIGEFGLQRVRSREVLPPETFAAAAKRPNVDVRLVEVLDHQLPMSAIKNAVLLAPDEEARMLALPRGELEDRVMPNDLAERTSTAVARAAGWAAWAAAPLPVSPSFD